MRKKDDEWVIILCDLDHNRTEWLYIVEDILRNKKFKILSESILQYFKCHDCNIFIDKSGNIRIYDIGTLGKLLFKTEKVKINEKDTNALKSNRKQDNGSFIALCNPLPWEDPFINTRLTYVEKVAYIGAYYDTCGRISRIFLSRLRNSNGDEVNLIPVNESNGTLSWRWSGNMSYRLCGGRNKPILNADGIPVADDDETVYNPLIAFNNYLCFEKVDEGSTGNYKILLPPGRYSREQGLSHEYKASFTECDLSDDKFF
jgi:hypothetical protein